MSIGILSKIGVKFVDLAIITFALLYLSSTIVASSLEVFILDLMGLAFTVIMVYVIIVVVVNLMCLSIPGGNFLFKFAKLAISFLLIFFLFPFVLNIVTFLMGYELTGDAQRVLLIVALIRAVLRTLLGRHFGGDSE